MKITSGKIFFFGSLFVVVAFIAVKLEWLGLKMSAEELSAFFTGLGFVGLVATFFHEREQAADADKEHSDILTAMRHSAYVTGLIGRIESYNWAITDLPPGEMRNKHHNSRALLIKELVAVSQPPPST